MIETLNKQPWLAIILTLLMVIAVREVCLWWATQLGLPSIGNILGMVLLLCALLVWRFTHGLPDWLIGASNRILTESALAYLPVSAGAGILLFQLGDNTTRAVMVTLVATIPPLWILAKLANYWLHHTPEGEVVDDLKADEAQFADLPDNQDATTYTDRHHPHADSQRAAGTKKLGSSVDSDSAGNSDDSDKSHRGGQS